MSNTLQHSSEDDQILKRPSKKRRLEEISNDGSDNPGIQDHLQKSNKKKKQDNPTRLEITPQGTSKDNQMIELKATASLPMKSPGTFEAGSKPTSANVKSFAALKMKSKLEKSTGSALNDEKSVGNISAFRVESSKVELNSQIESQIIQTQLGTQLMTQGGDLKKPALLQMDLLDKKHVERA